MRLRSLLHLFLALGAPPGLTGEGLAQVTTWDVRIARRPKAEKIVIDGDLSEPAWRSAVQLGPLTQVDPNEGAKATQPTEVRMCFDRDFFYLAIRCAEEPGEVRARLMDRDANLDPDDRVEFWLDTFNDRRFAYWFQIGAAGSRGDALIGGGGFNKSWDGIWYGESRVTSQGWQAEVAIPYKTIAFRAGSRIWGFNLRRLRKANEEETRWARPFLAYGFFSIAQGGTITGLSGMRQGVGLDVVPYVKFSTSRDRRVDKHTSRLGDAGLDLNYRITPALNLRLTYNTDFAETEVDARRVNLTRFPLFFPERRDFFLEDSGLFSFGVSGRSPSVIPFFSRRIGRDDNGAAVPIIVGAKLTGRVEDWNIGLLSVYQDEHVDSDGKAAGRRPLSVFRLSKNVGRQSSIGMITTAGNPTDPESAYTAGLDFNYGDGSNGSDVQLRGWWLGSFREGTGGDDGAYGLDFDYNSKTWELGASTSQVEEDFTPELGFVRRTGIREYRGEVTRVWRRPESFVRRVTSSVFPRVTTKESGSKDLWRVFVRPARVQLATDDTFSYDIRREFVRLPEGFEIQDGVEIPRGDYYWTRHSIDARTSERRWFYVSADFEWGGFYSGDLTSVEFEPTLILGRHARFGVGYEQNRVSLVEGDFTTHVWSSRLDFSFSPWVTWKNLVQYDTDSKNLGLQSRVRWIFRPGQELFLVGVYAWEKASHDAPFLPTTQDSALKMLYTIRF